MRFMEQDPRIRWSDTDWGFRLLNRKLYRSKLHGPAVSHCECVLHARTDREATYSVTL